MTRFYCDKCGAELMWASPNIVQNSMYANLRTMAQNYNSDGFKTYDPTSGMLLDLCINCRAIVLNNYNTIKQNDDFN